uniref:Uncharacterized protein n=1 Tax=Tanacetum cinerariifolium TaxID=118510 RepID=A0A699HL72_TANCI|nr:hypothetical protein [Tanacetum cinerariifolium]GEY41894.1 hypothetical protein [Tanacetum cinerariifolium]
MEGNKSIQRSDEQRNLYKALIEAYEFDKIILHTYGETVTLKRRQDDDADKDEEHSARPDRGSKRRREGKEPESASALTGAHADHLLDGRALTSRKPPSPDRDWNKTVPAIHESIQSWISELVKQTNSRSYFNELMDTPLDFSNFLINRLKVNPEGQQYPHNLLKPVSLIPSNRGRRVIPNDHFINNDLEYLCGGASSRYNKHALWGVSYWGRKRQQFYGFAVNQESAHDVYSKRRIIDVTDLKIVEWHSYKHLDWIADKKNRLMRIDELHKFSDGTLTDVRTALDDRLKGIRMQYLPQSIWRKSDKDREAAMIYAIDKRLKTRTIMRSLERFVGGRLYEGDFRMLQRTI